MSNTLLNELLREAIPVEIRRLFSTLSKGNLPHDPLKDLLAGKGSPWKPQAARLAAAVNQPVSIHINIGGKELTTVTAVIENEVVKNLARLLGNSSVGTLARR